VFVPFPADTDYFAADKQFMINLRVDDVDALITDPRRAGIADRSKLGHAGDGPLCASP
jgi:hypothetical protein